VTPNDARAPLPPDLVIAHTNDYSTACRLRDDGYEPIECAFGQHGSVLGRYALDHHGTESHREGVALRACRDLYGACRRDRRFVVTGTPDADAVLAIVALAGLVSKGALSETFYRLVDRQDVDPIGLDLFEVSGGPELAWFNQRPELHPTEAGFRRALADMVHLLTDGVPNAELDRTLASDRNRRKRAVEGIIALYGWSGVRQTPPGNPELSPVRRGVDVLAAPAAVLVVQSTVWGFDVWYRLAPVVVSYAQRQAKVTVGCPDKETAELLFGPGGLMAVWPLLGVGWGGRESVGGSPRGVRLALTDTEDTARSVLACLAERSVRGGESSQPGVGRERPSR
jgi:hypothetical protein